MAFISGIGAPSASNARVAQINALRAPQLGAKRAGSRAVVFMAEDDSALDETKRAAADAADGVKEGADSIGSKIKDAASNVGSTLKNAADEAADAVDSGFDRTSNSMKVGAEQTAQAAENAKDNV
mmetsp:Transcript_11056/g.29702  ORF Transcript_11056/g.29702 Transcript_11056/m.29702 type:complete len:125 (+) Transcript_11056:608-982(+)|eukprot:CAMPEP_0185842168 /NCGR_PEP_ID=MMETSP1353-20130828/18267_1 /TAXON_ID=1077150 /ORGANISM="Erythrolobus australicus, Strain CCMP3124" /LENGTH=124 /DNA_ID=CAMNT_0028541665 /DNA_START=574 /DNA_END=948 /DNA_ORIENTATION=-